MRTTVIAVVIFAMCITGLTATEVIRVDPNTPENQSVVIKPETDQRLATKVTYQADRKPVREILADLTMLTGVTFYAGYNNQDWQVRDRRMNIYVKGIPLANIMDSIARVMKFVWSRNDLKGQFTYRLYMNRLSILDEKRMLEQETKKYYERMTQKREGLFSDCARVSKLSEGELAALESENPYLYALATSGMADIAGIFAGNKAAAAGKCEINSADLSVQEQKKLLDAVNKARDYEYKIFSSPDTSQHKEPEPVSGDLTITAPEIPQYSNEMTLGAIQVMQGGKAIAFVLMQDPSSEIAKLRGKAWTAVYRDDPNLANASEADALAAIGAGVRKLISGDPLAEHPADPRLQEKYKLDVKDRMLILDVQPILAKTVGLGIVSDAFGSINEVSRLEGRELTLQEILDTAAVDSRYNWWLNRSIIEFRDREWYRKRSAQIPDKWIDKWRDTLKQTGTLGLEDLTQIACLDEMQMLVNISSDEVLKCVDTSDLLLSRGILSIYTCLTEKQRQAAMSREGVVLSPDLWERVKKDAHMVREKDPNSEARLLITKTPNGKQTRYTFMIATLDAPLTGCIIESPLYMEPEKEAGEKK